MKVIFFGIFMAWTLIFSVHVNAQQASSDAGVEKSIKAYYTAFEKKDWNSMELLLDEGFTFSSPVDDHISIKSYKAQCWPNAYKIKNFDIQRLVINGNDAFVTYNGWTTAGKLFRNTEYFKFSNGKIKENECFFGAGVNYPNNVSK